MDVTVAQGNVVLVSEKKHGPIVITVARSGPRSLAIELVVGDRDLASRIVSSDNHLAANQIEFVVVDPDIISANELNRIAAPAYRLVNHL